MINLAPVFGTTPEEAHITAVEIWENFYGPVQEELDPFPAAHLENAEAQAFADRMQQEIDL